MELARCVKSNTERESPTRPQPNTENELPNFPTAVRDNPLPKFTKSPTVKVKPKRTILRTESVDENSENPITDKELASSVIPKTEQSDPNVDISDTLTELPRAVSDATENLPRILCSPFTLKFLDSFTSSFTCNVVWKKASLFLVITNWACGAKPASITLETTNAFSLGGTTSLKLLT
jgi:hypothetical protein